MILEAIQAEPKSKGQVMVVALLVGGPLLNIYTLLKSSKYIREAHLDLYKFAKLRPKKQERLRSSRFLAATIAAPTISVVVWIYTAGVEWFWLGGRFGVFSVGALFSCLLVFLAITYIPPLTGNK
ncbi:hypothetical protein [Microbulbifer sp. SAOS-129_SWC]|uniref:hypothetical protein n=1 Tax=Microbulbifer sp. SAOS-129_SWC TaxID=3145235 RepID=UPI00321736AE